MFRASLCSSSGEQTIQKKLRVVNACNTEKNVKCSVEIIFRVAGIHHTQFFCTVCSPGDEHNDARNMLS